MAGRFYPIPQYFNDLSRSMNGLSQIYPSKFIAFKTNASGSDIQNEIDKIEISVADKLIDYENTRKSALQVLKNIGLDQDNNPFKFGDNGAGLDQSKKYNGLGDLNFLSYDIQDGIVYSDIYVNVSLEVNEKIFNIIDPVDYNENNTTADESVFDIESVISSAVKDKFEFNCIMLFYNLYAVDPETGKQSAKIVMDMPLGIYKIDYTDKMPSVEVNNEAYGATTWATRICSRFQMNDAPILVKDNGLGSNEVNTISKALTEIVEAAEEMKQNHKESMDRTNDIKTKLSNIKSLQNTPYIKGDSWYVNGRYVAKVITKEEITDIFREELSNEIEEIIKNNENIQQWIRDAVRQVLPEYLEHMYIKEPWVVDNYSERLGEVINQHAGHNHEEHEHITE